MIYVSKQQLDQVEYLIEQSIQGNHILFDAETVHRVFSGSRSFSNPVNEAYEVEHHIERVIMQPTLEEKRAYLDKLDRETFDRVVKTYFNIVENNIFENLQVKH